MKKYIVLLALCLCQYAFATGPSHTTLKIAPLSINKQGALLYKYKIIANSTGGHYREPVGYGVGSFKDGEFTSLKEQVVDGNIVDGSVDDTAMDYEKYSADVSKLDQWFSSPCKPSDLMGDFTSCNLKRYAVNRLMGVAELRQKYEVDITKAVSYFLSPGKLQVGEGAHIYVTYAFKGLIVADFDNFESCEGGEEENPVSVFIAQRPVDEFNNFSEYDYGYECTNVTGIIVRE